MSIWGKREVVIGVWAVVGMLSVYQVVIFYLQYQTQIQCQSLCIITSITYRDQTNDCWWEMSKERREVNNSILKNCFLRLELEEVEEEGEYWTTSPPTSAMWAVWGVMTGSVFSRLCCWWYLVCMSECTQHNRSLQGRVRSPASTRPDLQVTTRRCSPH